MRAVTMMWKGSVEDNDDTGEEAVKARPIVIVGLVELVLVSD